MEDPDSGYGSLKMKDSFHLPINYRYHVIAYKLYPILWYDHVDSGICFCAGFMWRHTRAFRAPISLDSSGLRLMKTVWNHQNTLLYFPISVPNISEKKFPQKNFPIIIFCVRTNPCTAHEKLGWDMSHFSICFKVKTENFRYDQEFRNAAFVSCGFGLRQWFQQFANSDNEQFWIVGVKQRFSHRVFSMWDN